MTSWEPELCQTKELVLFSMCLTAIRSNFAAFRRVRLLWIVVDQRLSQPLSVTLINKIKQNNFGKAI